MKHSILFFTVSLSLITLTGCANLTPPASSHALQPDKAYWLEYDSTRRGTVVSPASQNIRSCSEPAPDVALSIANKLSGGLTLDKTKIENGTLELNAKALQLAGRSQTVLALREALFRLCEISMNMDVGSSDYKAMFDKTMDTISEIAKKDQKEAEAGKAEAQAESIKAINQKFDAEGASKAIEKLLVK